MRRAKGALLFLGSLSEPFLKPRIPLGSVRMPQIADFFIRLWEGVWEACGLCLHVCVDRGWDIVWLLPV